MEDNHGNLDQQLIMVYLDAVYEVTELGFSLKIGTSCPPLQTLLEYHQLPSFAILTAYNPKSALCSPRQNEQYHQKLIKALDQLPFPRFSGRGVDPKGQWPDEPNFLILGISKEEAVKLGSQFGQNAIVYGGADGVGVLVGCQ